MAGRVTPDTPDDDKGAKYKYLRIKSETKNEQISLNLSTKRDFFGEDRIKSADFCFITEGLADCIVANQFGFPCLALGSTMNKRMPGTFDSFTRRKKMCLPMLS